MKSLRGNIGPEVYSYNYEFNHAGHITQDNNEHANNIIYGLISDFGAPEHLTFDSSLVQVGRMTGLFKLLWN